MDDIKKTSDALVVLAEVEEYFDQRSDADYDDTGFVPNEEMKLLVAVRAVIEFLEKEKK
jgi:hypothetical protein